MNIVRGTAEPGQTRVNFTARAPLWAGAASSEAGCTVFPSRLATRVRGAGTKTVYSLTAWLTRGDVGGIFPFGLRTGPTNDNSMTGVLNRASAHLINAEAEFPIHQSAPLLSLAPTPPAPAPAVSYSFKLTLPPFTAIYSMSQHFFEAIGFDPTDSGLTEQQRAIGGRGTAVATAVVYGYFNPTAREVTVRGDTVLKNETVHSVLTGLGHPPLAGTIQMQVEFMNAYEVAVSRTNEQSTSVEVASTALSALVTTLTSRLNLRAAPLVVARNKRVVTLTSVRVPNATATLDVLLNPQLCAAFGLPSNRALVFAMGSDVRYELKGFGEREDPFEELYPVTAIFRGLGDTNSWVDGEGYVALAATIADGKGKQMLCDGATMHTATANLAVEFRDYKMEPITFTRSLEFRLVLKFSRKKMPADSLRQQQR